MDNRQILEMIDSLARAIEMIADGEPGMAREIARAVIQDIQDEIGDKDGEVQA